MESRAQANGSWTASGCGRSQRTWARVESLVTHPVTMTHADVGEEERATRRDHRQPGAPVGRARRRRGPDRGSGQGIGPGLAGAFRQSPCWVHDRAGFPSVSSSPPRSGGGNKPLRTVPVLGMQVGGRAVGRGIGVVEEAGAGGPLLLSRFAISSELGHALDGAHLNRVVGDRPARVLPKRCGARRKRRFPRSTHWSSRRAPASEQLPRSGHDVPQEVIDWRILELTETL